MSAFTYRFENNRKYILKLRLEIASYFCNPTTKKLNITKCIDDAFKLENKQIEIINHAAQNPNDIYSIIHSIKSV